MGKNEIDGCTRDRKLQWNKDGEMRLHALYTFHLYPISARMMISEYAARVRNKVNYTAFLH